MNAQKVRGVILVLLALAGLVYCCIGAIDRVTPKNPLVGIIFITAFLLFGGVATLREAATREIDQ